MRKYLVFLFFSDMKVHPHQTSRLDSLQKNRSFTTNSVTEVRSLTLHLIRWGLVPVSLEVDGTINFRLFSWKTASTDKF